MEILTENESAFVTKPNVIYFDNIEECLQEVRKVLEEQLEYLESKKAITLSNCIVVEGWYSLSHRKKP